MVNSESAPPLTGATETDAKTYWIEVVQKYLCGDIEALLHSQDGGLQDKAGPLLNSIMAGIDTAGGCLYGFRKDGGGNSKSRSEKFMEEKMALSAGIAKFLYERVRCGMSHEGVTKPNVEFRRGKRSACGASSGIYKKNERVGICVDCLARHFLEITKGIDRGESRYSPTDSGKDLSPEILKYLPESCGCPRPASGDVQEHPNVETQRTSSMTPGGRR